MGKKCYRAFCALMSAVLLFSFLSMMAFALPPSGSELYRGIDVSEWQGAIDFSRVRQSGIQVVYIRSSLGSDYTYICFHFLFIWLIIIVINQKLQFTTQRTSDPMSCA